MPNKNKRKQPAYVPPGSEINLGNVKQCPPRTKYEKTRAIFDRDIVDKIVKGKYGSRKS